MSQVREKHEDHCDNIRPEGDDKDIEAPGQDRQVTAQFRSKKFELIFFSCL